MKEDYDYVGFDIHKKTIAICAMDSRGNIVHRTTIRSRREDLKAWLSHDAPPRWKGGMEATLFTGWVYDTIKEYNDDIVVGNPQMLTYIANTKRKNDRIDARKIANLIRCDLFPSIYMVSRKVRMMRNLLRYRHFIQRQITRYKNHTSAQLMSDGIEYENRRLHGKKYFMNLLSDREIEEEMLLTLTLNRQTIEVLCKMERRLRGYLLENPALRERVRRLMTIDGVGEITALTWCLEIDDPHRFSSIEKAVSYCGLCSAEKESGGKSRRGPLSKIRNKHLQWVLIEAAKLGVEYNERLAEIYEKTCRHKDHNAATIATARRMVGILLAMDKAGTVYERDRVRPSS